jgi:hypothetical protein
LEELHIVQLPTKADDVRNYMVDEELKELDGMESMLKMVMWFSAKMLIDKIIPSCCRARGI